ncbi:hypothetical protein L1987_33177 [Smallanthus sonchifolius]|uniref:Uncharacterized protein n=1 Tax=Smallanthus sonchifolius TaxID=185202 RepID=A0ACB9HRI0_9ASTR|nr:hypothetical protein L1987_33177 [Smallanthus sonchifolius]
MQGASKIIAVDINGKKAAKGNVFGMTDFINPKEHPDKSVSELVREITHGLGVDYCFECTGVPSLLNEALEASKFEIQLDELLTHEIQLDNIQEAFEILKKPDCLKILINF